MFWCYYMWLLFQHRHKKTFSLAQTAIVFAPQAHVCNSVLFSPSPFVPFLLSAVWSFWVFFQVRGLYFGKFWILERKRVHVSVRVLFCPRIYKHVPSISSFHRHAEVSVEDRSPSLCASLNCRLVFPIFLPEGEQEHISHICGRSSLLVFPLLTILKFTLHISLWFVYLSNAEWLHCVSTCMSLHVFFSLSHCYLV